MPSPSAFALFCLASLAFAVVAGPAVTYIVLGITAAAAHRPT